MPIERCTLDDGAQGWRWGSSGKCYPDRADAERQAQAAHAAGYTEKVDLCTLLGGSGRRTTSGPARVAMGVLLKAKNLDAAAHDAATSPLNLKRTPTDRQREAGNYAKGHTKVAGLKVSIENPAGSRRRPEWPTLNAHYGYIVGTRGRDGDAVDVFLRPGTPEDWGGEIYVIDQVDAGGRFDEHKVMVGYDSQADATRAYLGNFDPGWTLGPVTAMTNAEFRRWLKEADTTKPAGKWKTRLDRLTARSTS